MTRAHRSSPQTVAALAGAVAVLLATGAARADWLVTRDGARLETKGAWKVDGRRVLFTLPNGTLSTMRTDEIDLDQSALVTTQAKEAPAVPVPAIPAKKEPVLRLTEKDIPPMGGLGDEAEGGKEGKEGKSSGSEVSALEVISWEKTDDTSGEGLEIFGTLKNGSPNIITAPSLLVAIYDADGGLLATNGGEVNAPQIEPGKTANFRVAFPGVPDFATAKFEAQGRGYRPGVANRGLDEESEETEPVGEPVDLPEDNGGEADAEPPAR
jgi:hypothetical protein